MGPIIINAIALNKNTMTVLIIFVALIFAPRPYEISSPRFITVSVLERAIDIIIPTINIGNATKISSQFAFETLPLMYRIISAVFPFCNTIAVAIEPNKVDIAIPDNIMRSGFNPFLPI